MPEELPQGNNQVFDILVEHIPAKANGLAGGLGNYKFFTISGNAEVTSISMRPKITGDVCIVWNLKYHVDIVVIFDGKGFKFTLIFGEAGTKIGDSRGVLSNKILTFLRKILGDADGMLPYHYFLRLRQRGEGA